MINAGILDGDIVIVERRETARNGEIVVAMTEENEVTLKTFYKENGHIRLQPENDTMEPFIFDNVFILGKASTGYDTQKGYYISLSVKDYDKFYKETKKVSEMEDNRIVIWLDYEEGTELTYIPITTKNSKGKEETTYQTGYYKESKCA